MFLNLKGYNIRNEMYDKYSSTKLAVVRITYSYYNEFNITCFDQKIRMYVYIICIFFAAARAKY